MGGNMIMAPKSLMRAVPDAAATRPEHRSDSSYANFGPYTPAVSMAHDRATTLVLMPAMTLGIVHFLVSSSNLYPLCVFHRALASTSVPGFGSPPERKNGEPMRLRTSHGVVSMRLIADAIVPPSRSYERTNYSCQGTGRALIESVLDNQLKLPSPLLVPKQQSAYGGSEGDAVDLVKDAFASAAERDIYTGDQVEIVVINKDGTRRELMELKRD